MLNQPLVVWAVIVLTTPACLEYTNSNQEGYAVIDSKPQTSMLSCLVGVLIPPIVIV